jgi:two-component system LytT family response regulator
MIKSKMRTEIKLPGIVNCPIKDIIYIEGKGNYSLVHLATKKEIYIAKTLKKFESHFRMHKFIRIHKSYLVNQENIPSVDTSNLTQITTSLGNHLPISRRKLASVKQKLS